MGLQSILVSHLASLVMSEFFSIKEPRTFSTIVIFLSVAIGTGGSSKY